MSSVGKGTSFSPSVKADPWVAYPILHHMFQEEGFRVWVYRGGIAHTG
jgi:hypothetical protein